MAHLEMTDEGFDLLPDPVLIRERTSISSPADGSWTPLVDAGQMVRQGQTIGTVTDWHGRTVFEAISPIEGLLLLRLEAPPVRRGETVAMVAVLPEEPRAESANNTSNPR